MDIKGISFNPVLIPNQSEASSVELPPQHIEKGNSSSLLARKSTLSLAFKGKSTITGSGVRLEKTALLSALSQGLLYLDDIEKEASIALHKIYEPLAQRILIEEKAVGSYQTLGEAIEMANQKHKGSELVIAITENEQIMYAVVPLKKETTAEQLLAQLGPVTGAYLTDKNGVLQPLQTHKESSEQRYERVLRLSDMAIADEARGFDLQRTGDQRKDRTPAYRANLSMVHTELSHAIGALKQDLERTESEPLRQKIQLQINTLETADEMMMARLLQMPKSPKKIPQSDFKYGEYRNKPEVIIERLESHILAIKTQKSQAQSPELRADLEKQQELLQNEVRSVALRSGHILDASLKIDRRLDHLGAIGKALQTSQHKIRIQLKRLQRIEQAQILGERTFRGTAELPTFEKQIEYDRAESLASVNKVRTDLIVVLKKELEGYQANANENKAGAKEAVELLGSEIKYLEALANHPDDAPLLLNAITQIREKHLSSVMTASQNYVGISPKEAEVLKGIDANTETYAKLHKSSRHVIRQTHKLAERQSAIESRVEFSMDWVDYAQYSELEKVFLKKLENRIKTDNGPPFARMKVLYTALEMAKNKDIDWDIRGQIKRSEIEAELRDKIPTNSRYQSIAQELYAEAAAEVFANEGLAATRLEARLKDPEYLEYLDYKGIKAHALKKDLAHLNLIDPAAAKRARDHLAQNMLYEHAFSHLQNIPEEERKDILERVIEQTIEKLPDGAKLAGKSAKIANLLSKQIGDLSGDDLKKMTFMQRRGDMDGILETLRIDPKMPGVDPDTVLFTHSVKRAKRLNNVIGVTSAVATYYHLSRLDSSLQSNLALGSSTLSTLSHTDKFAKLANYDKAERIKELEYALTNFGDIQDAEGLNSYGKLVGHLEDSQKMGKLIASMEYLGPVADIIGVYLDADAAVTAYAKGDMTQFAVRSVSTAASIGSFVAGAVVLSGTTGPAAPIALAAFTATGLVCWGVESLIGESGEETFLRENGLIP